MKPMTPDEIARLRAVAKAATGSHNYGIQSGADNDVTTFRATFRPALILRLLDLAQHAGVMRELLLNVLDGCETVTPKLEARIRAALAQREDDKERL